MNYVMTRERMRLPVPNWYLKECYNNWIKEWGTYIQEDNFYKAFTSTLQSTLTQYYEALKMVNWPTAIFLTITPILGLYGLFTTEIHKYTLILSFVTYIIFGLGITAGNTQIYP